MVQVYMGVCARQYITTHFYSKKVRKKWKEIKYVMIFLCSEIY